MEVETKTSNASNGKTKKERVAVVAAGIVSPLGLGLEETYAALRAGRDCIRPVDRFDVAQCRCKTAGQVRDEWLLNCGRGGKKQQQRLHRAARMMICALGESIAQDRQFRPELTVIGTTSGGMSFGQDYYRALLEGGRLKHSPGWIANYPPQKPAIDALETFGISSPCQVVANACASGTNAIGHAFECIRSGKYQRILTGGYDALSELVFVGFDSLQAATPEKCRPFDRDRTGMVLGEGAGVLALENFERAKTRGAHILAEITGYGVSTDNFHLTQPDPSGAGPRQAMERSIAQAETAVPAINYVNAHGTATLFNDAAEGKAIGELFASVPVSSTKAMMGHSLGAAGAIEAIFCLLALEYQFLPPNINFQRGDDQLNLNIVANTSREEKLETAVSNSFGFGGTNASIVLQKFGK